MSGFIRLWRDRVGAALIEFTIVFPIFMLVAFGTVDASYMLFDFARANKAVYIGAHRAIVSSPVASEISTPSWNGLLLGTPCADLTTGLNTNTTCPTQSATCTYSNGAGNCGSYTFDPVAFANIASAMQSIFNCNADAGCPLQRSNISIAYQSNGLGFDGQPNGSVVNITVSIKCMTHRFYFLSSLMQWTYSAAAGCQGPVNGFAMPAYATTLTSEDLSTN